MAKRDDSFENEWVWVKRQSLATAAREAGFDLAMFERYSVETQLELRKKSVKYVLRNIADSYEWECEEDLSEVKYGVYVIRLSSPFIVDYSSPDEDEDDEFSGETSQIIYIGRGDVLDRLGNHFEKKLFDFMQSLSGAEFDIQILNPSSDHYSKVDLHKQIEHDLLNAFTERVTYKDSQFPLLNKKRGDDVKLKNCGDKWDHPLRKRDKRKIEWTLKPTEFWRQLKLDR